MAMSASVADAIRIFDSYLNMKGLALEISRVDRVL